MTAPQTVLLVDDQPAVRRPLRIVLERDGYRVLECGNGKEAIQLAQTERPQLIVMDLRLPQLGGLDAIELLKSLPDTRAIPVIVLSALAGRPAVLRALQVGAQDYLLKANFNLKTFQQRVAQAIAAPLPPPRASAARAAAERTVAPPPQTGGFKTKEQILQAIAQAEEISALPTIVLELLSLMNSDSASARDLAAIIIRDQALTARVIRMANSSFYGGRGRGVIDVHSAVVTIGVRGLAYIAAGISILDAFSRASASGLDLRAFLEHSIAVAVIARQLAAAARHPAPDEVFVQGMLHDIGKPFLAQALPTDYGQVVAAAREAGRPLRDEELDQLGIDHRGVGRRLSRRWCLPLPLEEAIFQHDDSWSRLHAAKVADATGLTAVWAANLLAKAQAMGHGWDTTVDDLPLAAWEILGIAPAHLDRILETAFAQYQAMRIHFVEASALRVDDGPASLGLALVAKEPGGYSWPARLLGPRGFEVADVPAAELLDTARAHPPALVVLEIVRKTATQTMELAVSLKSAMPPEARVLVIIAGAEDYDPRPELKQRAVEHGLLLETYPLALDRLLGLGSVTK